jgi:hypothetical protein
VFHEIDDIRKSFQTEEERELRMQILQGKPKDEKPKKEDPKKSK